MFKGLKWIILFKINKLLCNEQCELTNGVLTASEVYNRKYIVTLNFKMFAMTASSAAGFYVNTLLLEKNYIIPSWCKFKLHYFGSTNLYVTVASVSWSVLVFKRLK